MKKAIIIAATGAILIASVCISAFASSQNTPEEASVSQSAPNKYVIKSEVISEKKFGEEVSGDSYLRMELQDLRQLCVLSDGVGSGENAQKSSQAIINMLERLLNGGFSESKAIEIVNSIAKLKGEDETYATLDAAIINQKDAMCYFIKLGAAPTYLIEKGNANDDEEVDEKDIMDIVNYLMGKQTSTGKFDENEADINGDNMINIADIVKIVKKIKQIR